MSMKEKTDDQLRARLNKNSGATKTEVRSAIAELKKRGLPTPPPANVMGGRELSRGGDNPPAKKSKKKVPAISISVGMVEIPKGKNKAKMMRGGMANKKEHMYAAGGSVTDNAGLRALKASGPKGLEAYNKITGK